MKLTKHPMRKSHLLTLGLLIVLSSCVTNKKTTYLQEVEDSEISTETYVPSSYKIQPNDNLFIRVVTPDPRWSVMFNTIPIGSGTVSATPQSVDLFSYEVRADGTVHLPYLGSIAVEGKTISEAREILEASLAAYVADAAITVKLVNSFVSILGEVTVPGIYPIYKEQLNIFQALAMAGDIDDFGNRYKVKIIRQTSEGSVVKEFNILDEKILDSEFYYVMPNDVIYAEPMKGKFFGMNYFPLGMALSAITTFLLVLDYIQ